MNETAQDAFDAVREATRSLIAAAERADVDAIHESIDQRAGAMQRLEQALGAEVPDPATREEWTRALASQAADAEAALRRVMENSRQALQAISRGARVLRGYASNRSEPTALDRAG